MSPCSLLARAMPLPHPLPSYPAKAGIQQAAASRVNHNGLWNTASSAFAFADEDSGGPYVHINGTKTLETVVQKHRSSSVTVTKQEAALGGGLRRSSPGAGR